MMNKEIDERLKEAFLASFNSEIMTKENSFVMQEIKEE